MKQLAKNPIKSEEWGKKLQKLHDKLAAKDTQLKSEVEAHNVLKLDNKYTVEEHKKLKQKHDRFKEQQRIFKEGAEKCRDERDQLRGLQVSLRPEVELKLKASKNSAVNALARVSQLEAEIQKFTQVHKADTKTIQQLSQQNEADKKNAARITELQENLAALEEIQKSTKAEIEKEKAKVKIIGKGEAVIALEQDLEEEREKSKKLEARLAVILNAAAM